MQNERRLKKDLFGEVLFRPGAGLPVIVRDAGKARWWIRPLARYLLRREATALAALDGVDGVPQLIEIKSDILIRSYLGGAPMQEARPRDRAWFNSAAGLLRRLHSAGVVHNDLAKEPNLLVLDNGRPGVIDFQLAAHSSRRGRLFRIAAYEDIRHLLKHKRTYCADFLTQREKAILANPSPVSRAWMATVKPVYLFVTRRLLGWADREGAGDRGAQQ
ncbi:MAG: RIO1 family regulatory kinase/ATPase [Woeseiaceae bacterium]